MKNNLSIRQRMVVVGIYILTFGGLCWYFNEGFSFILDSDNKYNLLFVSGALLLIFGTYITEPFFTRPVDIVTNSIAIILALLSVKDSDKFIGYYYLLSSAGILLLLSVIIIVTSDKEKEPSKLYSVFFRLLTEAGRSKIAFSCIYILTVVSYFQNKPIEFAFFITFWVVFTSQFVVEDSIKFIFNLINNLRDVIKNDSQIGQAIGCENPFLYKVEIDFFKHKAAEVKKGQLVYLSLGNNEEGVAGVIINEKYLLNKKWVTIYLLEKENSLLKVNLKTKEVITGSNTIYSRNKAVYAFSLDDLKDDNSKKIIEENYFYKNRANFIGYIADGSDINKIRFHSLVDAANDKHSLLKEGSVIKTNIYKEEVLFQIIDGKTSEEELEKHNIYGYLTGVAQKLGKYNQQSQELEVVKWLPSIYSPVFFDETENKKTSSLAIGKLPETNLEIVIKELDSLVTHNTAILGILGIGKSCLTFELIQKIINQTDAKIICIDITNEYQKELNQYVEAESIVADTENSFNEINSEFEFISTFNDGKKEVSNHEKSGNQSKYKESIKKDLNNFFFSEDTMPQDKKFNTNKRVRIYNPDYHKVSKGEKIGFNVITTELSQAEKTRIIAEETFRVLMKIGVSENNKARALIVFEEAHSLIPEWNSTAYSGDQSASNGTAKVILQGRKYGLGSFVVTQRTANISKSILNQCNTIFALRIFDDTGKTFLENYIGYDYSNTLPTLEERHAIAVGKALKLKQPVIIKLNNKEDIILNLSSSTTLNPETVAENDH